MNQIPESARRRLRAQSAGDHPDADLLTAFAEHTLAGNERELVLSHLAACATCREVVALAMPEQSDAEGVAPAAPSWFRWPVLRWTAAAAAVVIVGAAVSVLVPRKQEQEILVPVQQASSETKKPELPAAQDNIAGKKASPSLAKKKSAAGDDLELYARLQEPPKQAKAQPPAAESQMAAGAPAAPQATALHAESAKPTTETLEADKAKEENAPRKDALTRDAAASKGAAFGGVAGGIGRANVAVPAQAPAPPPPPSAETRNEAVAALRPAAPARDFKAGVPMALSKTRRGEEAAGRWRVSSSGAVEYSADGKVWKKVEIDAGVTFRAMSSNDGDLWAGGTGGALFHSADAGRTWSRVKVGEEGMWVAETITSVEFSTPGFGVVSTAAGATWITQDGGRTWRRRQ